MKEKLIEFGLPIGMILVGYVWIRTAKAMVEQNRRFWAKLPGLGKFLLDRSSPEDDAAIHAGMGVPHHGHRDHRPADGGDCPVARKL